MLNWSYTVNTQHSLMSEVFICEALVFVIQD